jgi:two-component system NtrC family sensor kinase
LTSWSASRSRQGSPLQGAHGAAANRHRTLASLGTLSAGVAHEINNPLAIINDAAGWLADVAAKDDTLSPKMSSAIKLALTKIDHNVQRAKKITHQLLSFSRQNESVIKEFDICAMINEVVDLTRKIADDREAAVVYTCAEKEISIWSDPFQLRQVIVNLVTNGIQAVEPEGKVSMFISGDKEQAAIEVRDNGPGIPAENLERIFEPFFTTKPPGQGTGLGLSVSRGIIEKLGGKLTVKSKLGAGAAFKVTLPRKPVSGQSQLNQPEAKGE